ncbi:MAG: phosphoesterase [Thiotrichales bacterium]|nr:MAG: phosphoesterase [Thiotrichales bacterium]
MARKKFRGISKLQEQPTSQTVRDIRPLQQRIRGVLLNRTGLALTLGAITILAFCYPIIADISLVIAILIFWFSFWAFKSLPFKMPIFANRLDPNDIPPGSEKAKLARGIYFFGNEINSEEQLWFNDIDMRTHVLIFGSTGSGKTEALISIAYNSLIQGSGFIFVDGKGDNSLFAKIFSMVRSVGREDDLLIVNFMTGGSDVIGPQKHVLSNTMNPFALGSSSMLAQLVVSLMDSSSQGSSDGDMWKGRAISFIEALMRPLVYLREEGHLLLEAGVIRKYFTLDAIEALLYDRKVIDQNNNITILEKSLPFAVRDPIENYLATLPGYQKSEKGKQNNKAYEQHGYISMQLTRIFGSLADVYGHIIRTNLAEVDFKDVVLNRRILVVLLPALEKSPDELANLGKLIIASLKTMLAAGLGERIEGDYQDVILKKPTNAKTPFLCILDEYGYYAVKGFAIVPAQARSLGFSVIFAGQDLPAFQKASKEEAASICANTNIKVCMKLEDPGETWEFFQKTAGETYVSVARSFTRASQGLGYFSYKDTLEAQLDKRSRLDLLDLKDQREGEAHIFFKSLIIRARFFYANPTSVQRIKINQFVKVKTPTDKAITMLKSLHDIDFDIKEIQQYAEEGTLKELFVALGRFAAKDNVRKMCVEIDNYIEGRKEEEEIDFGDQTNNPSIFMMVPVDERLGSEFFDVEVSGLQDSILTKEKLYEVVKRLSIMDGKSESHAKKEAMYVINTIEGKTNYSNCYPENRKAGVLAKMIKTFLDKRGD